MSITKNYHQVLRDVNEKAHACGRYPQEITVIAVSKNFSINEIQSVYQEGGRQFGESYIQEATEKISCLPADCQWHFIGTLQSNKVGRALSSFQLIHSVDTPLLAQKISHMAQFKGITASILLQVNISEEKSKHGLSPQDWQYSLDTINQLANLKIEGLMTMAPYTQDHRCVRLCFRKLCQLRDNWRKYMKDPIVFKHLSMGMSNDYLIAIEEGATLLRIGSAIFSE